MVIIFNSFLIINLTLFINKILKIFLNTFSKRFSLSLAFSKGECKINQVWTKIKKIKSKILFLKKGQKIMF